MSEKEVLQELLKTVQGMQNGMQEMQTNMQEMQTNMQQMQTNMWVMQKDISEIKDKTQNIENRVENIESKVENIENRVENIENRVENIENRVQNIEERTLKLEITQENVTNKHIALLMEGQQLNAEKLKAVDQKLEKLDNIEAGMVALEAITMQNTIKIKEKIGEQIPLPALWAGGFFIATNHCTKEQNCKSFIFVIMNSKESKNHLLLFLTETEKPHQ